jgi:D-3-phosphoglycerate dehydrogenase / 2-oxoglutarate reductase
MRGSILVIDDMHPSIKPGLQKLGFNVNYRPEIRREEILEIIPDYLGLIVRSKTDADRELIDRASKLKFIARAGAGTDKIDEAYCNEKNIIILNSPEGNKDALAEHALGMLLALLNHMTASDRQVREYNWDREGNRGTELHSKSVGIIGYGNMGAAFARRLVGFSCHVLAYDKYKTGYDDIYARESSLDDIFSHCDILSLHVPLTEETQGYYNLEFFSKFQNDLWLINTARGGILPLNDLLNLLKSGKIKGAALDVLEIEPPAKALNEQKLIFDELIKFNNVILTPHVGGWTFESYRKINEVLLEKIGRLNIF